MTDEVFLMLRSCFGGKQPDEFVFTRTNGERIRSFRESRESLCCAAGLGQQVCPMWLDHVEIRWFQDVLEVSPIPTCASYTFIVDLLGSRPGDCPASLKTGGRSVRFIFSRFTSSCGVAFGFWGGHFLT